MSEKKAHYGFVKEADITFVVVDQEAYKRAQAKYAPALAMGGSEIAFAQHMMENLAEFGVEVYDEGIHAEHGGDVPPKEPESPLSDEQAKRVSDLIHDSSKNIYRVAEDVLGRSLTTNETDPVYDHVSRIGDIFKCAECNVWKATSEKTSWRDDCCTECDE